MQSGISQLPSGRAQVAGSQQLQRPSALQAHVPMSACLLPCAGQVNLAVGKHLRLPVKGCGLACLLKVQPEVLHFGIIPTYQWADQLLQLSNGSSQLPMQLSVVTSGPYFSSLPGQLELAPGVGGEVVIRYRPKVRGASAAVLLCWPVCVGQCCSCVTLTVVSIVPWYEMGAVGLCWSQCCLLGAAHRLN